MTIYITFTDIEVVEAKGGNYKFMEEDNVLILTRENFHYFIMSRPIVLVEFYAPWRVFKLLICVQLPLTLN